MWTPFQWMHIYVVSPTVVAVTHHIASVGVGLRRVAMPNDHHVAAGHTVGPGCRQNNHFLAVALVVIYTWATAALGLNSDISLLAYKILRSSER